MQQQGIAATNEASQPTTVDHAVENAGWTWSHFTEKTHWSK